MRCSTRREIWSSCELSGELDFLGRRDHQVKIRGYRIDTGEIREMLRQHPDVNDALVVSQTQEGCDSPSLIAYLACADPASCPDGRDPVLPT